MNFKLKSYFLQQDMKMCRTMIYLSFVLLCSACASAVIVEQSTNERENDDRTELQKQLDNEITTNVKKRFKVSSVVGETELHVSTYKHVVTVNGFVKNKNQKLTALRLALSVSGVKSVISDIGIQKE